MQFALLWTGNPLPARSPPPSNSSAICRKPAEAKAALSPGTDEVNVFFSTDGRQAILDTYDAGREESTLRYYECKPGHKALEARTAHDVVWEDGESIPYSAIKRSFCNACFAGVWMTTAYFDGVLEPGDVGEAIAALNAVGAVEPGSTHPTSAEREAALMLGYLGASGQGGDSMQ